MAVYMAWKGMGLVPSHKWVGPGPQVAVYAVWAGCAAQGWSQLTLGWGQVLSAHRLEGGFQTGAASASVIVVE